MEIKDLLTAFYSAYDEEGRLLSPHGQVEYLTTMRYIQKYLKPGMRILEIGTATGRYAHALARMGYEVDGVELVEHNIRIFRENTQPGERITIHQGDARNLEGFADESYDLVLLLGPMYHLFTREDQHQALAEAVRVTKPGGILMAAYCGNEATMIQYCFVRGMIREIYYRAKIDPVTFKCASDPTELFELFRREEIEALTAPFPLERLHYVGTDMATHYMRDTVDAMDQQTYEWYLAYHFSICERADLVGASNHILDILRRV